MTWRDQLRPASFRGVPFFVRDHQITGGRRGELHEYPGRDDPFAEDLGLKARQNRVEGYVLGDDYMGARDRLLAALEAPGPGALVHPYLGTLQVAVLGTGYSMRESKDQGGFASFSITFSKAGANRFPSAAIDTRSLLRTQADFSEAAAVQSFEDIFAVSDKPDFVSEDGKSLILQAVQEIEGVAGQLAALPGEAPAFVRDLKNLRTSVDSLILTPGKLASRVLGSVRGVLGIANDPLRAVRSLLSLNLSLPSFGFFGVTTPSLSVLSANRQAITSLVRRASVISAGRGAADIDFESRQAATTLRDLLGDALEDEILIAGDAGEDGAFAALSDLRASVVRDLTARGAVLPGLTTRTPGATLPALVLAHDIAGDDPSAVIAQAEDIVARNKVRHPGFVPGGREIEVLLDGR